MGSKVALVTGSTGGIGSAICRELANQGFTVVAGYNSGGNHEKAANWKAQQAAEGTHPCGLRVYPIRPALKPA